MGEVIRFRPREGVIKQGFAGDMADGATRSPAQILLFTGVRYERHGEAGLDSAKPHKKRGRPRKRA
jgi:hypothetical protein